jgi:outer membrane cobalamin receptor
MRGCNTRTAVAIVVTAALLGASSAAMAAQQVEEVIVTGSRIARPNLESAVPITTVSGKELVERIDVVTGGNSAIYGADAIWRMAARSFSSRTVRSCHRQASA